MSLHLLALLHSTEPAIYHLARGDLTPLAAHPHLAGICSTLRRFVEIHLTAFLGHVLVILPASSPCLRQ